MRSFPALRLGGQVFCCVAVLSFFVPFCRDLRFFWLLATLILAVSLAAVRLSGRLSRLVLALVPAAAFLIPVSGWISMAAGAAILLYMAVVYFRGDFFPYISAYRTEAVCILFICGFFTIIAFFRNESGLASIRLLICAVLLVLLALRMRRVEGSMGLSWQAGSAGMLMVVLVIGILAGILFWQMRSLIVGFIRLIAYGIAWLWGIALVLPSLIMNALAYLTGFKGPEEEGGLPELSFPNNGNLTTGGNGSAAPADLPSVNVHIPWIPILTAAVAAVLVLAAIRIIWSGGFSRQLKYRTRQANGRIAALSGKKRKVGRREMSDNRSRMRYIYRRYLDDLRRQGITLHPAETTEEITKVSSDLFLHTDEQLRSLYRKARYSREPVTDEELDIAAALLEGLTADENRRQQTGLNDNSGGFDQ